LSTFDRRPRRQRKRKDPVARYLGDLQARVMEIFWARESATVREVADALKRRRRPLAYTTVLTLVTRLWSRGFLKRSPEGRGFRYRAAGTREEFLADRSDELIDRLFTDFGEIALARLNERLDELDARGRALLKRARRKK
jgi:predicted transcriptional regulator